MGKCKICDSRLRPGGLRRILDRTRTLQRVCVDCASMLTPPEELDSAPVRAGAGFHPAPRNPEPAPDLWPRTTVRATAATTVALAPRGWTSAMTRAMYLALAALAFSVAATAWLLLT